MVDNRDVFGRALERDLERAIINQDDDKISLMMKKISIYLKRGLTPELTLLLAKHVSAKKKQGRKRTFQCYETFNDENWKWNEIIYEYRKLCKQSHRGAATEIKKTVHPTKAYLVSWRAIIFSLKNSISL